MREVDDSVLSSIAAPAQDVELDFLKRTYGPIFERALRRAFEASPVRDRNLLRYHFGRSMTIDELGRVYRVHRATAARRIQRATARLVGATRELLAADLGIPTSEVSSIFRLMRSQIEILLGILAGEPSS